MEAELNEVDEHLQFAYEACCDTNAYTSSKTVCQIIADGIASSTDDKAAFAYSVFPELRQ